MKINKAVITCAGPRQRKLPLQTLIDRDGKGKSVLEILVEEVLNAGIDKIGCVVFPGDENTYADVVGDYARHITFIGQKDPFGYGHAVYSSSDFVGNEPFLHLVGDHLYVSRTEKSCAAQLVSLAEKEECSISAVSAIRESSMPNYGVIGGKRVKGMSDLYKIENVVEKPTPTEAEQKLFVPGLRSGHYLCFFGMHVLTPSIFKILENKLKKLPKGKKLNLSDSLDELSGHEQYLALEKHDWRYDVGTKYGLLKAQIALALSGKDRDQVLSELLELFTSRELRLIGK
ncbi:MAG: nucleotidyl transferase [Cyclobacteriaceae bacterium]|jgi:UTP--glucose-1-phosphate uridylyltransferase|nr:nucleotidyl transferase [Cyclobacteriaceae bacterium]